MGINMSERNIIGIKIIMVITLATRGDLAMLPMALLALAMLVSGTLLGCAAPSPTVLPPVEWSIVDDYPDLAPVVDFVGEENLSVLHLLGFKASERAMSNLGFEKGNPDILALTDAGYMA
ncbi:unnamed protein product, partial [marine sediment metagenome]